MLVTVAVMLVVIFARRLAAGGLEWLTPVGQLAWPWYVPLGTALCVATGWLAARLGSRTSAPAGG
ncbi:MAG: hypothetical protein R2882_13485 [Gemmatimonadales bacterium]